MKRNRGIAAFAALVGAIAVWNASPAGAEEQAVVAQAAVSPAPSPAAKPAVNPAVSPSPSPSPTPTATPVPHALSFSGYGDIGYSSASNASSATSNFGPGSATFGPITNPYGQLITGRVFDNQNNTLMFHNFNVQVAYVPPGNGFGGKVEYSFGDDSTVIHSYPQNFAGSANPGNYIDMTQAYGSFTYGPVTAIVGKFETLAGAEVIESPSDLNFSRSILFGYAVPFTHTGGRITYAVNPALNVIVGANQGWDTTTALASNGDINALTYEFGLALNPNKAFSLTAQGYTGPVEQGFATVPGFAHPIRTLGDLVATFHLTPAFTTILNVDYGTQNRTIGFNSAGGCSIAGCLPGTVSWDGAALYLSYTQGLWTLTGRGEYFADNGGSRTATVYGPASRDWTEGTVTLQYAPNTNLIFRAEYRYDASTNPYFLNKASTATTGGVWTPTGLPSYNNSGVGLEAIVRWP